MHPSSAAALWTTTELCLMSCLSCVDISTARWRRRVTMHSRPSSNRYKHFYAQTQIEKQSRKPDCWVSSVNNMQLPLTPFYFWCWCIFPIIFRLQCLWRIMLKSTKTSWSSLCRSFVASLRPWTQHTRSYPSPYEDMDSLQLYVYCFVYFMCAFQIQKYSI